MEFAVSITWQCCDGSLVVKHEGRKCKVLWKGLLLVTLHLYNIIGDIIIKHELLLEYQFEKEDLEDRKGTNLREFVNIWDWWNWFRNVCVDIMAIVCVINVELPCCATKALGSIQQCREESKYIEKKMCVCRAKGEGQIY